jgi:hypothetical protein
VVTAGNALIVQETRVESEIPGIERKIGRDMAAKDVLILKRETDIEAGVEEVHVVPAPSTTHTEEMRDVQLIMSLNLPLGGETRIWTSKAVEVEGIMEMLIWRVGELREKL